MSGAGGLRQYQHTGEFMNEHTDSTDFTDRFHGSREDKRRQRSCRENRAAVYGHG